MGGSLTVAVNSILNLLNTIKKNNSHDSIKKTITIDLACDKKNSQLNFIWMASLFESRRTSHSLPIPRVSRLDGDPNSGASNVDSTMRRSTTSQWPSSCDEFSPSHDDVAINFSLHFRINSMALEVSGDDNFASDKTTMNLCCLNPNMKTRWWFIERKIKLQMMAVENK
jgi:hypothetical protein